MRVRDWMNGDPIVVSPDTEVREARRTLHLNGVRHLPVVDGDRLVGIVSDRDIRIDDRSLRRLAALERLDEALGEDKPVEAVMTSDPYTIGPDEPIEAAARLLLSRRVSALPVVEDDDADALVGIITTTDCLLALLAPDPAAGADRSGSPKPGSSSTPLTSSVSARLQDDTETSGPHRLARQ
ncbi:MAG: CBS domain-containing protein [Egibacteraceae bacterium]